MLKWTKSPEKKGDPEEDQQFPLPPPPPPPGPASVCEFLNFNGLVFFFTLDHSFSHATGASRRTPP